MSISIIVEDGTSVEGANAYLSVADTTTRLADFGRTGFASLTADQKTASIYLGTLALEAKMQNARLTGVEANSAQGLSFPRSGGYFDGELLETDELPQELLDVAALEAGLAGQRIDAGDPEVVAAGMKRQRTSSGSEVEFFSGGDAAAVGDPLIEPLIRRLLARPRR